MFNPSVRGASFALLVVAGAFPLSALACATCGCSLSTDAATGFSTDTGWRASLQYDFINQNQLRSGTHTISASQVAAINDAGGDQEVEHDTVNRYITLGLSYSPSADWNAKVFVPYIDRGHSTYGSSSNPLGADDLSGATIKGLGDIRVIGTWQGLLERKNLGFQFGIKLPTGDFGGPNAADNGVAGRHPTPFRSGPAAQNPSPDNLVDTSLQPGTGSTDLIFGTFYHQPVSEDVDAFVNAQFQTAVANRLHQAGQDYRPGNTATVSFGARYEANSDFVPQLQVNVYRKGADQGALADTTDTAGTVVNLSPGATFSVRQNLQVFGFAQVPVFSHLAGYQLAPRWTASAGVSYGF
jgi:hypothetical protein